MSSRQRRLPVHKSLFVSVTVLRELGPLDLTPLLPRLLQLVSISKWLEVVKFQSLYPFLR